MKQIKKKRFILFVALVCLVTLTFGVYAALSTSGTIKRVVAARTNGVTSDALRFSSNYLSPYESDATQFGLSPISINSDSETDVSIGITVCNYPQDNALLMNDQDIEYSISLTVFDSTWKAVENSGVSMALVESSQTLKGKERSIIVHKITIPASVISNISKWYLQVVATPVGNSWTATSNKKLAANLQIIPASHRETAWTGISGDQVDDFSQLDAFNYQISGTEQATLKLSWNNSLVTLSKWSQEQLNPNGTIMSEGEKDSITFSVGGQDTPTIYMLQFYLVGKDKPRSFDDLGISLEKAQESN